MKRILVVFLARDRIDTVSKVLDDSKSLQGLLFPSQRDPPAFGSIQQFPCVGTNRRLRLNHHGLNEFDKCSLGNAAYENDVPSHVKRGLI